MNTEQLLLTPDQSTPHSVQGNARLFVVYNSYRALVAFGLLVILVLPATQTLVAELNTGIFISGCTLLLLSAVTLMGETGKHLQGSETRLFSLMLFDVTAITLISSGSTGVLSGLSGCT